VLQEKQVCSSEGTVAGMGCYTLAFARWLVSFFSFSFFSVIKYAVAFLGLALTPAGMCCCVFGALCSRVSRA